MTESISSFLLQPKEIFWAWRMHWKQVFSLEHVMNQYNRFLNSQGESVNICDPLKRTPLHVAASEGQALENIFSVSISITGKFWNKFWCRLKLWSIFWIVLLIFVPKTSLKIRPWMMHFDTGWNLHYIRNWMQLFEMKGRGIFLSCIHLQIE